LYPAAFFMMKKLFILAVAVLITASAFAQKSFLILNEQNQYAYYQVKNAPNVGTDTLQHRALQFLKKNYPQIKITEGGKSINGKGNMLVYKSTLVASQEEGAINYNLQLDFKDGKYRLLITNFVYVPYERSRYGTFEPVNGLETPLEKEEKFKSEQLTTYLDKIGGYSAILETELNKYLVKPVTVKADDVNMKKDMKKVSTKNW
jgi:hypothetical protein